MLAVRFPGPVARARRVLVPALTVAIATVAFLASTPVPTGGDAPPPSPTPDGPTAAHGLSMPFVETATDDGAAFVAPTFAGTVRVSRGGTIEYLLPGGVALREQPTAPGIAAARGGAAGTARVSIFRGDDPARWRSGLATFETVRVDDLVPGVDLEVAAGARNIEKRFQVAPGVDLDSVRMRFEAVDGLTVLPDGRLEVATPEGAMTFTAPVAFHETAGGRVGVPARYVVRGDAYGFAVDGRDPSLPLFIDPLIAATYLGGQTGDDNFLNDTAEAIDHFAQSVYVVGSTQADIFPNDYEGQHGYLDGYGGGWTDAFVCRLNEGLSTVEAVTFLGGSEGDIARGVDVTADGVFVVGVTGSPGFPTTFRALQGSLSDTADGFVTRLTHDLETLTASTFLGGDGSDDAFDVVVDMELGVVVTGRTRSEDLDRLFPELSTPYQRALSGVFDAFVVRLDHELEAVYAGTLLGGSWSDEATAVALDGGQILICGNTSSDPFPVTQGAFDTEFELDQDGFVARFDTSLGDLLACTFLGGEEAEYPTDECLDIAIFDGDVFVCGATACTDFPTTPGAFDPTPTGGEFMSDDGFVVRLSGDLTAMVAGTMVGGPDTDEVTRLAIHAGGVVTAGRTNSSDFPLPPDSEDNVLGGSTDAFLFVLSHDLSSRVTGRFVGGSERESAKGLALAGDVAFLTGETVSVDFPTTAGAFDRTFNDHLARTDAYIAAVQVFDGGEPPPIEIDSYILPKRLDVRHHAKKPAKSWLNAGGWFDTGSGTVDWSLPATLTIGETEFAIPGLSAAKKGWWEWTDGALFFRIKPSKYGSSKGKFKLKWKSEAVTAIPIDDPLVVRFVNNDVDAIGEVTLEDGRYKLGRQRGALIQPRLALYSCKTTIKGGDKDTLRARLGLSTEGDVPHDCPPLTIGLDDQFVDTIESDAFDLRKRKFVFKGPKGGLSKATVDYGKEKLAIHGKKIDAGSWPEGPQAVSVLVRLGEDALVLRVRMVRDGKNMRY